MTTNAKCPVCGLWLDGMVAATEVEVRARLAEEVKALRPLTAESDVYDAGFAWAISRVLALIQPEGDTVKRHPITGAPLCCCLGGREKCDHHAEGAKA